MKITLLSALVAVAFSLTCFKRAYADHQLVERLVLFPLKVDRTYSEIAEGIWWDARGKLTENKRHLIASKNFMESKGVFQARSELQPADAILLGRLLDGHGLLTLALEDLTLTMRAYDGRSGQLLAVQSVQLHPSVPVSKQLKDASLRLTMDFISSFPYQGNIVVDEIAGRPVFKEGNAWVAYINLGEGHKAQVGDRVQTVRVSTKNLDPLFQTGGQIDVLAEGKIKRIERSRALVEFDRLPDPKQVQEKGLVRLPNEQKRLQDIHQIVQTSGPTLEMDALGQAVRETDTQKERKPLVTAVSFITNIVIMFLVIL